MRLAIGENNLPSPVCIGIFVSIRTRALTKLEKDLADRLPELQHVKDASSSSEQTRELDEAWEEAAKAVAERYGRVPHLPQWPVFALAFLNTHLGSCPGWSSAMSWQSC